MGSGDVSWIYLAQKNSLWLDFCDYGETKDTTDRRSVVVTVAFSCQISGSDAG
jgi:hypothetical protein